VINDYRQHATGNGTNVVVTPASAGSVVVSGANSTAIGSQSASGRNSNVVGTSGAPSEPESPKGWWARLRQRGLFVALFTVIGGAAGVVGAVVAVIVWLHS
jgi:hypothetical protein